MIGTYSIIIVPILIVFIFKKVVIMDLQQILNSVLFMFIINHLCT